MNFCGHTAGFLLAELFHLQFETLFLFCGIVQLGIRIGDFQSADEYLSRSAAGVSVPGFNRARGRFSRVVHDQAAGPAKTGDFLSTISSSISARRNQS
jgi:hypothetical protein